MNVTVPVASMLFMMAVNVTEPPTLLGLAELVRVVLELALVTVCVMAGLVLPA